MRKGLLFSVLYCLLFAVQAPADPVWTPYVGANVVAFNHESDFPSDFEIGGGAAASLSPHISAIGSAWYGLDKNYLRGKFGARVTATDVDDPHFSIGLGPSYNVSSKVSVRPQEWTGDVAIGWVPYPQRWPRIVLGAEGSYGFDSNSVYGLLAARYTFRPF